MDGDVPEDGRSADSTTGAGPSSEKRKYNRRAVSQETSPPYYDVFVRIASALEGIEAALQNRVIDVNAGRSKAPAPRDEGVSRRSSPTDGHSQL